MMILGFVTVVLAITINRYGVQQHARVVPSSTTDVGIDSPRQEQSKTAKVHNGGTNEETKPEQGTSPSSTSSNELDKDGDDDGGDDDSPIATMSNDWKLLEMYPHDPTAFTQGLEIHTVDESSSSTSLRRLLVVESTGHYGYEGRRGTFDESSTVRIWDVQSGNIMQRLQLDEQLFGEGLTKVSIKTQDNFGSKDGRPDIEYYLMLTWREHTALLLNTTTLQIQHQFQFDTHSHEGWGVACDPRTGQIYVSDGSHMIHVWELYFADNDDVENESQHPEHIVRYNEVRRFPVSLKLRIPGREDIIDRPELNYVNELEWDPSTNTILANIYFENLILRICPKTGRVLKVYDFNTLYPRNERTETAEVFNGIAIIPDSDPQQWLLTGKYWPHIYKVQVDE
jgi:glutaminyl-peptide cyclotransferase